MRTLLLVSTIVLALPLAHSAQSPQPATTGTQEFVRRVEAYVSVHRQIERDLPPSKVRRDADAIQAAVNALADALRRMRPHADEGNIFSPPAAREIRRRIGRALAESRDSAAALLDEMEPAIDPEDAPAVNEPFSWALPNAMPPFVLLALPELPDELQYRFVGTDLVLIDIHATLVVDILRDVLPAGRRPAGRVA